MPKGKTFQIWIPGDLVDAFEAIPKGERSAFVQEALKQNYEMVKQYFVAFYRGGNLRNEIINQDPISWMEEQNQKPGILVILVFWKEL